MTTPDEVLSEPCRASADLRSAIRKDTRDLIRWMFVFWLATIVPLGALMIAVYGR